MTNDSAESRDNDMATANIPSFVCPCLHWAMNLNLTVPNQHHHNCDGTGRNKHSYATEADVPFSHSTKPQPELLTMTLIQKLQQDYFDSLPERWNTDGTRKPYHRQGTQVTFADIAMPSSVQARLDALREVAQLPATIWDMSDAEQCQRCGGDNPAWSAPSPLWNAVMRGGSINGESIFGDMVCATCFMVLAEEHNIACLFQVTARNVNVDLELVTPNGRVWNDDMGLWVEIKDDKYETN